MGENNEKAAKIIKDIEREALEADAKRSERGEKGKKEPYKGPIPEIGSIFKNCELKGVHNFGCFVEILPGLEGLVHISELHLERIHNIEGFVKAGDKLDVKLLDINEKGQFRLSRKALLQEQINSVQEEKA